MSRVLSLQPQTMAWGYRVCAAPKFLRSRPSLATAKSLNAAAYYRALRYVIGRAQVLNLSLGGERMQRKSTSWRKSLRPESSWLPRWAMSIRKAIRSNILPPYLRFVPSGRRIKLDRARRFRIPVVTSTSGRKRRGRPVDDADLSSMTVTASASTTPGTAHQWQRHMSRVRLPWFWRSRPKSTPAQVIKKLTSSADRVAGATKGSAAYGAGRLNCEKALNDRSMNRKMSEASIHNLKCK